MQPQRAMPWMARPIAVAMAAIAVAVSLSEAGPPPPRRPGRVGPASHPWHAGSAVLHRDPTDPAHAESPYPMGLLVRGLPSGGGVMAVCKSRQAQIPLELISRQPQPKGRKWRRATSTGEQRIGRCLSRQNSYQGGVPTPPGEEHPSHLP